MKLNFTILEKSRKIIKFFYIIGQEPLFQASGIILAFAIPNNTVKIIVLLITLALLLRNKQSVVNNNNFHLKEPMRVNHLMFSNNEVLQKALNRQLDNGYKVNMILELIENDDVSSWEDDELQTLIDLYEKARWNCFKQRDTRDYETKEITKTETKTEEEYQKALLHKEKCLKELKEYLENKFN
jgi:hypothetical protein